MGGEWRKTTVPENFISTEGAQKSRKLIEGRTRRRNWDNDGISLK